MEVINKPKVNYTKKSLQFFFNDRRKIVSAAIIVFLPFLNNVWRLVPEDITYEYYGTLLLFVWTIGVHLIPLCISIAWYLSVPRKDRVLQIMALAALAYSILITLETIPFTDGTPLLLDLLVSGVIFLCLYFCLQYIQKNYLDKPNDYKALHDGLVYDLHHQRFLGSINRIAGLLEIAEMDEPYKCLCTEEINELKESIAYIAEKYESLN